MGHTATVATLEVTMSRRLAAIVAALAMTLVLAAPVAAGGWAEIVADAKTSESTTDPTVGAVVEVGFTVLQHGETPAPWETATVHFTNASTGETLDVAATNDRPDGHFVARADLPAAGYWIWQVTLRDLASDHLPVGLTVRLADGSMPRYDPADTFAASAGARHEIARSAQTGLPAEVARLDQSILAQEARTDRLTEQVDVLAAERDALAQQVAAAVERAPVGSESMPVMGVITLAVLAGAAAGFATAWLGNRPGPRVTLSPAPREADPA